MNQILENMERSFGEAPNDANNRWIKGLTYIHKKKKHKLISVNENEYTFYINQDGEEIVLELFRTPIEEGFRYIS